ncbi:uncharacterized protein LOC112088180 [Eutrema salsugineum]|uniref:uncharacterized protein LOC112088180 n=1 Tax=Eutrema salsugineum TaxID=72664 RepID=UPI000CED157B|nr:uncharacterized protein LOC112088180 [Eutrema salsugineum]
MGRSSEPKTGSETEIFSSPSRYAILSLANEGAQESEKQTEENAVIDEIEEIEEGECQKEPFTESDPVASQNIGTRMRTSLPRASKTSHRQWIDSASMQFGCLLLETRVKENGEEHSNYSVSPTIPVEMKDFQDTVRDCSVFDLGYHDPLFTWANKRSKGLVCKKLDRDLFLTVVGGFWETTTPLYVSTSAMHRFSKKLKALKPLLRALGKEKLGDLPKRTREAYDDLCIKQTQTLQNPDPETMEEENQAYEKWDFLAGLEESFRKQQSKLHWLNVGDGNTKAFPRAAQVRKMQNTIREIRKPDGETVTDGDEIKQEAERFFKDFLSHEPDDFHGMETEEIGNLLDFRCDEEDTSLLEREVTAEEIKKTLFSMPTEKSPGPDGFTSEFFKAAWSIVGDGFIAAISSFFVKGFLPKGLNATILALIPKKEAALEMRDYRPISYCNVLYKVISKIVANCLKIVLPKFISQNQSAYVKNRLLMENVLLAAELVKHYHKTSLSSRYAMKIDISKAFDSVQWPFLINVLTALDFPEKFIHWIRLCVTTASFSVQVNGELAGFFQSKRGLRQGCSLSPYLFVICMDVLSKMIDKAAIDKQIGYHPGCKNLGLTHLCFADDLMIFVDGKKRSIENTIRLFDDFEKRSGLQISLEKSTLYLAGVSDQSRDSILETFPFGMGQLPIRYLGLPLLTKKMAKIDYEPLSKKIRGKISSWIARSLSFAGRLQLIRSVLMSISNFGWQHIVCLENKILLCGFSGFKELAIGMDLSGWLLKYREIAKSFHRVEVHRGDSTSFWCDDSCAPGRLIELTGPQGYIDLGIPAQATVRQALVRRRRRHRLAILNQTEAELDALRSRRRDDTADVALWLNSGNVYKTSFVTKWTWQLIREVNPIQEWHRGVWFPNATPKYSFFTWLALLNRLSMGHRMQKWNVRARSECFLCDNQTETRDHLFFSCSYSSAIWRTLTSKLLGANYTSSWNNVVSLLKDAGQGRVQTFLIWYVCQSTIHHLWRERNRRKHGEPDLPQEKIVRIIDKNVRNQISSIRLKGDQRYNEGLTI